MKLRLPDSRDLKEIIDADKEQSIYTSKRYYSKVFGVLYINRLKMVVKLLGNKKYGKLLDMGFGSGFFLPELRLHCDSLFGIDIHKNVLLVKEMLRKESVSAKILFSNAMQLPFKKESFDCVVCLSVLEFIDNTDSVISEITRVAKPQARIIIGAPVLNKITDFCYDRLVKSKYHRLLHKSDHRKIINSVRNFLFIEKLLTCPFFFPCDFSLFFVLTAKKKR